MFNYDPVTANYLAEGREICARALLWVKARNWETSAVEELGLWTGDDHRDFVIGGETRTYYGAGGVVNMDAITYEVGMNVRMHRVVLNPIAAEVVQLLRGYDVRLSRVEIHRALFDVETTALKAEPHRRYKGFIDEAPIYTPVKNGRARAEISIASSARAMTIPLVLKKSDETQQLRQGDRFRRYADITDAEVWWGDKRYSASPASDAPATVERDR